MNDPRLFSWPSRPDSIFDLYLLHYMSSLSSICYKLRNFPIFKSCNVLNVPTSFFLSCNPMKHAEIVHEPEAKIGLVGTILGGKF